MVRIINIDTKARTIRVSNGKDDLEWFTTDTGSHVPLKKGQSKAEAIKEHFGDGRSSGKKRLDELNKKYGTNKGYLIQSDRPLGKKKDGAIKEFGDFGKATPEVSLTETGSGFHERTKQPAKKDDDIMSWPFHKAMELPGDDPRLVQYLKAHHAKWKASKENDKIETIKDKIIDGLTEGVYSQDYTQLVAKELDEEIAETEKQPAKQDKKSNPQLERLEKMGKAWGKDQMSVLRELGKTNPQGLKDELDRIEAERERTTKAHKEWIKGKADKQQPAKKSAAQIFKDAGDDTGWKSIKSGSHHQFFDENNWAQREHEYVYLPDGDDSFDNYARIEKDTDGDPRVVVTLVKDGERVYKDPFDGYDDQAGNMQAAIEAVARAFGK